MNKLNTYVKDKYYFKNKKGSNENSKLIICQPILGLFMSSKKKKSSHFIKGKKPKNNGKKTDKI